MRRLFMARGRVLVLVHLDQYEALGVLVLLDYVEAQDDYIALHSEKKNYLKQQTISSIEAQLDAKKFVRIHRSYIVNLERIARIEPYTRDSRVAVLNDGTQLPVSRSGHAKLKTLLGETV